MFEPKEYIVQKISGDYAILLQKDIKTSDGVLVALALLPLEIYEGTTLLWENLEYKIV